MEINGRSCIDPEEGELRILMASRRELAKVGISVPLEYDDTVEDPG